MYVSLEILVMVALIIPKSSLQERTNKQTCISNELRCLTSISKLKYVCITDSITSKKESSKKIASLTSSLLDAKLPKIKQTRTTNSCKVITKTTNVMEPCIRLAIYLAPVIQTLVSPILQTNHYPIK